MGNKIVYPIRIQPELLSKVKERAETEIKDPTSLITSVNNYIEFLLMEDVKKLKSAKKK